MDAITDALVVKGDSVDEALAQALKVLNAQENEVEVQVLDWGEPGILGIGGRPAAVRVAVRTCAKSSQRIKKMMVHGDWGALRRSPVELGANRMATFAVIRDGRLIVRHPETGPFPMVMPCLGIEMRINGKLVQAPQRVTKDDKVSIRTCSEEIPGHWSVELTEDEVQAVVKLQPRIIRTYKLCDSLPSQTLRLKAEKEENFFSPLTFSELLDELNRLGVTQGIDWNRCREITEKAITGEVVVAEGVPATQSQDGFLELFCLTQPRYATTVGDLENVDFRERFNINSVVRGAVLACKHPPILGTNGVSVKGELVLPRQPVDVALKLGRGVELQNETEVIAVEPGRPVITERGRFVSITVEPALIHPGNVDLASGNLSFSGHIRVLGDVQDGMLVNAGEDVVVQGLVSAATVQAGGSVHIWGNVISSTIVAGGPLAIVGRFLGIVDALALELDKLIGYMRQLRKRGAVNSATHVIQFLLQYECQTIPLLVRDFEQMVGKLPPRLNTRVMGEFVRQLSMHLGSSACRGVEEREVESLLQTCKEWQSAIHDASSVKGDVQVDCLLNSSLTATGRVMILGECNDHSHVQAGGTVAVCGAFRGGEILADGTVLVRELGTPVGTYTTVSVPASSLVKVGRLYENVLISVGKRAYLSYQEETDVHFSLDVKEDKITKIYAPVKILGR